MALPMIARGHVVGAITFAWAESGRRYTDADLPLAEEIARRAGLAVDNARLHRETEERARAALVLTHVGDGVFMIDSDGHRPPLESGSRGDHRPRARAACSAALRDAGHPGLGGAVRADPGRSPSRPRPLGPRRARPARDRRRASSGSRSPASASPEGTVYAFRDLTEERALEKMRSDFVATISHELRTPLAAVYGAAVTLIQRDDTLDRRAARARCSA